MPNLERFSLGSCSCIRLSAISPPSLTHLNLSNINFVNYPRGLLSAQEFPISILSQTLKHLVLHNTEFNSKFLKSIYKCKKIEYLDISYGSIINNRATIGWSMSDCLTGTARSLPEVQFLSLILMKLIDHQNVQMYSTSLVLKILSNSYRIFIRQNLLEPKLVPIQSVILSKVILVDL